MFCWVILAALRVKEEEEREEEEEEDLAVRNREVEKKDAMS